MPRLIGHRRNPALGGGIAVAIVVVAALILEAFGVIDIIPGFGQDSRAAQADSQLSLETLQLPEG